MRTGSSIFGGANKKLHDAVSKHNILWVDILEDTKKSFILVKELANQYWRCRMGYSFIHRGGHIEVVDAMGRFVLSADTIAEAHKELAKELEASRKIE